MGPSWYSWLRTGLMPWYRRPPAWLAEGMKPLPRVYIFARGGAEVQGDRGEEDHRLRPHRHRVFRHDGL